MATEKLGEITIKLGDGKNYTLAEILELSPELEVEWIDRVSRWTGTGYTNDIYRVVGTEDAIVVENNHYCEGRFFACPDYKPGYFAEKRSYAKECGKISRKTSIPFEVVLAIGPNHPMEVYQALLSVKGQTVTEETMSDLCAGINRRKYGCEVVLGSDLYNTLQIGGMGQSHSTRVALYIASLVEEA